MNSTIKTLKILLVGLCIILLFSCVSLYMDLTKVELKWIIVVRLCIAFLLFLCIIIVIWDLTKKDFITHTGRLIRNNGSTISVLKENGKMKKYRINYELFVKMRSIEVNQEIEIVLFRRTRAVAQIQLRSSKAV